MRIAVIGATGNVGARTAAAVRAAGHEVVPVSRSAGVDVTTGAGLDDALAGVAVVVDTVNAAAADRAAAERFFGTETRTVLDAERRAGVGHHVLLSIVGIDRVDGNPHYAGKRRQEELVEAGPVPWTIQRATQFFGFAAAVTGWTATDGAATIQPLLVQPVDVDDVAAVLAELAAAPPAGRVPDLAGPRTEDLVDMARRTLDARGTPLRLIPTWRDGVFPLTMAGEVLLPGPGARLTETDFDAWLARGAR